MRTTALMFGTCILVALFVASAEAGQCTAEIENVTKLLASQEAGSGPTVGSTGTTTGHQIPPTSAMGAVDSQAALNEARGFDQSGKEPECMAAIQRAKRLGG